MFLTRIPLPGRVNIGASDVGRSMLFFPLVGAGIGGIQWLLLRGAMGFSALVHHHTGHQITFPAPILSVVIVAVGVWTTGALHLDGVADMADGFGGGHTRDDVLRIMRDHAIGAYGAVALGLVLALKLVSVSILIERGAAWPYLIMAPTLARAAIVALGFLLPYARASEGGLGAAAEQAGLIEVLFSTATAAFIALGLAGWRGGIGLFIALVVSSCSARICMRRIHGMTGDTLGANSEICEAMLFATGCILSSWRAVL